MQQEGWEVGEMINKGVEGLMANLANFHGTLDLVSSAARTPPDGGADRSAAEHVPRRVCPQCGARGEDTASKNIRCSRCCAGLQAKRRVLSSFKPAAGEARGPIDCRAENKRTGDKRADLGSVLYPLANRRPLRYKQVGPMSECIRASLSAQGFLRDDSSCEWVLAWGSSLPDAKFAAMRADQAHNHIPGFSKLNNKGMLAEVAESCRAKGQKVANNVPQSWVLPTGMHSLAKDNAAGGGPYILKPIGGTRGKGIKLFKEFSEEQLKGLSRVVVQRYIKDPHLINGRKYDLRLYVTVTNTCPMRVYLHEQGYARFCSEEYDLSRTQDMFRHVTNSNYQKFHKDYDLNKKSSRSAALGNKWHLEQIRQHWRKCGSNMDSVIMDRIKEAVMMAFVMFESLGFDQSRRLLPQGSKCFCLFGIDVMLDSKLKPWLLELNGVPSTGTDSPIDIQIKSSVIGDLLSLVGLCSRDPAEAQLEVEAHLHRSLGQRTGSGVAPRGGGVRPGRGFGGGATVPTEEAVREKLARMMKRKVTDEHVGMVLQWEQERARRRGWQACFPCPAMGKYSSMLKYREANDVMLAWMKTQMLRM